jgi:hypothetical protein
MDVERLVGGAVMLAIGVGTMLVGHAARHRRIDLAMGAWSKETATPESWADAHRVIGAWLMAGGAIAVLVGVLVLVVPTAAVGPVAGLGAIVMLVPVVVGVVIGTGRIRPSGTRL